MTNEEMLDRISDMLKAQESRSDEMLQAQDARVSEKLSAQAVQIALLIENAVTKRLDALYDMYMITHDKQLELEREVMSLGERVERLEVIAG